MKDETSGRPKLVDAPGHMFSDGARKVISIIGLASVGDLARVMAAPSIRAAFAEFLSAAVRRGRNSNGSAASSKSAMCACARPADQALPRQCRSRNRRARSQHPARALGKFRPCEHRIYADVIEGARPLSAMQ